MTAPNGSKACLLKVTEERAAILRDPDFDCLAANTAAGGVICADPSLALAETELNGQVLGLIGKLDSTAARFAFAEYGRWTRSAIASAIWSARRTFRLPELESAEECLADYLKRKANDIAAAKGDPKKVFGRQVAARIPDTGRRRLLRRADSRRQFLRQFPPHQPRLRPRQPGLRPGGAGHRRDRDGRAGAVHDVQQDCIHLHRHLLGPEDRTSAAGHRRQERLREKPSMHAPPQDPADLRLRESRRRLAPAGRTNWRR
ncbi:hypothetical protein ACRAWF_11260 [Streptomyces sp. L7]